MAESRSEAGGSTAAADRAKPAPCEVVLVGTGGRALAWLERAVEERDAWAVYIRVDPWFSALRGDPRFQQIVRSAGIP